MSDAKSATDRPTSEASRRRRNIAIALMLGAMVMAFYAATFVRFGQPIAAEMLKQSRSQ